MLKVGNGVVFLMWVEVESLPEATGPIQLKATNNKPTEKNSIWEENSASIQAISRKWGN